MYHKYAEDKHLKYHLLLCCNRNTTLLRAYHSVAPDTLTTAYHSVAPDTLTTAYHSVAQMPYFLQHTAVWHIATLATAHYCTAQSMYTVEFHFKVTRHSVISVITSLHLGCQITQVTYWWNGVNSKGTITNCSHGQLKLVSYHKIKTLNDFL